MKKFLTIKEFSRLSGIGQTTLRYWDEIDLFPPARRDPDTKYRYYTPEQLITVNFITVLSNLKVPLKTIVGLKDARSPGKVVRLLDQQEKLLDMEMRRLRECYSFIHTRLELIRLGMQLEEGFLSPGGMDPEDGVHVDESTICVQYREEKAFILGLPNDYGSEGNFFGPFLRFCRQAHDLRINLNFPVGGYHGSMDAFLREPGLPEYFFSLDPTGNRVRAAGKYMVGFARGSYGELGDLPARMTAFAEANVLAVSGPVYSIYLHDEICLHEPSRYLVQVCVAVSGSLKTRRGRHAGRAPD